MQSVNQIDFKFDCDQDVAEFEAVWSCEIGNSVYGFTDAELQEIVHNYLVDEQIRNENPTLKKLWEKYQTARNLVK